MSQLPSPPPGYTWLTVNAPDGTIAYRAVSVNDIEAAETRIVRPNVIPVIATHSGLHSKLSIPFTNCQLTARHVNRSGRSPKLTFTASVSSQLSQTEKANVPYRTKTLDRPIYLEVSVPQEPTLSVTWGVGNPYLHSAMFESGFVQEGSWHEKKPALNFLNMIAPRNGAYWTAAALTMAHLYTSDFILVNLGIKDRPDVVINETKRSDDKVGPLPQHTTFMPHSLGTAHKASVLSIVAHALKAHIVKAAGGHPQDDDVFNMVGDLPETVFDIQDFWEAYHILSVTSSGSGSSDRFDSDFLIGIVQNFGLHGNCHEGGIYRRMWKHVPVEANRGVVVSNYTAQTTGYIDRTLMNILGSAITLQTVISRTLYECQIDDDIFCEVANCTNDSAKQIMCATRPHVIKHLSLATGLSEDYWSGIYGTRPFLEHEVQDRHININEKNYFRQYSTWIPSYCTPIGASEIGEYSSSTSSINWLSFNGKGKINCYTDDENNAYVTAPMNGKHKPSSGFFWMRVGINKGDGLSQIRYSHSMCDRRNAPTTTIVMYDGTALSVGDSLDSCCWRDNFDFMPSACDSRTPWVGEHFFQTDGIESVFLNYSYNIEVTKYRPLTKDNSWRSSWMDNHRTSIYGKIQLKGNEAGRKSVTVQQYAHQVKRLEPRRAEKYIRQHQQESNFMQEGMKASGEERDKQFKRLKNELLSLMTRYDSCIKFLEEIRQASSTYVTTGSKSAVIRPGSRWIMLKNMIGSLPYFKFITEADIEKAERSLEEVQKSKPIRYDSTVDIPVMAYGLQNYGRSWSLKSYIYDLGVWCNELTILTEKTFDDIGYYMNMAGIEDDDYQDMACAMLPEGATSFAKMTALDSGPTTLASSPDEEEIARMTLGQIRQTFPKNVKLVQPSEGGIVTTVIHSSQPAKDLVITSTTSGTERKDELPDNKAQTSPPVTVVDETATTKPSPNDNLAEAGSKEKQPVHTTMAPTVVYTNESSPLATLTSGPNQRPISQASASKVTAPPSQDEGGSESA